MRVKRTGGMSKTLGEEGASWVVLEIKYYVFIKSITTVNIHQQKYLKIKL